MLALAGAKKPAEDAGRGLPRRSRRRPAQIRLRRPRPLRRDGVPLPHRPRRPISLHPQLHARPAVPPGERLQGAAYPVWNLLKELDAEGKLNAAARSPHRADHAARGALRPRRRPPRDPEPGHLARAPERLSIELRSAVDRWIDESNDQGKQLEPPELAAAKGATKADSDPNGGARQKPPSRRTKKQKAVQE